ncbi:hypothetical protein TorRG33x02_340030 [Trema orientale]|uniref:Uncharacterized protein n=1 Tax=Trema orientale TaxID=63057 RepID=A0A2P5AVH8_TREOI|nr:hypothetical protein TorRG33x02_340030 [Trema orientale]
MASGWTGRLECVFAASGWTGGFSRAIATSDGRAFMYLRGLRPDRRAFMCPGDLGSDEGHSCGFATSGQTKGLNVPSRPRAG